MKKKLLFSILCLFAICASAQIQINKLGHPSTIGWPNGWYSEGSAITIANDGSAIKISGPGTLSGKMNVRFTPSVNGQYTLKFLAKKDNASNQTLNINILRTDAWRDLTGKVPIVIDSDVYKEYSVTFPYDADVLAKTPQCFQLEVYADGVQGSIWMDNIRLYENNNNLAVYSDDFETDLYYGLYLGSANSWNRSTWNNMDLPTVDKTTMHGSTVLQYTQNLNFNQTWDATMFRTWWAIKDVQYRVKFDISTSVSMPNMAIEIWFDGGNKIHPTEEFATTTTPQTKNFITTKALVSELYKVSMYSGKVPQGEKVYIDNFAIYPIHLYNPQVESYSANQIKVNWLQSGYLPGDKMDVVLINTATNDEVIIGEADVVDGSATLSLTTPLVETTTYSIKLKDKVQQVFQSTLSPNFIYSGTTSNSQLNNSIKITSTKGSVYLDNLPSEGIITIFDMSGRILKKQTINSNSENIKLQRGIYFIKINDSVYKTFIY